MNVAFDGCKDDFFFFFFASSGFGEYVFDNGKGDFCGVGTHEELGKEHGSFFKAVSNDVECGDQFLLDDLHRIPCFHEFPGEMMGFFLQAFFDCVF